jgi:type I restriction enzyme, S subunit
MTGRRYKIHRDSGGEWVGDVPIHWHVKPLCAVAHERGESNVGMVESNLLSLSYGRIVQKDIESNDGLLPESFETYQVVRPGDIVFRLTDLQNDKRSLRTAIVNEVGIITSAYLALVPSEIRPEYASYLFRSYDTTKVFYSMGGGLRQSMKFSDIRRLPVLLPPSQEQAEIASFLDHETSKIDALIDEQKRLIELLKEKRQAVISQAVTKGLDPNAPMKESGVEWLGRVPEHWELGGLTRFIGPVVDYRGRTPTKVDDGVFLVTARNIRNGKIDYSASEEYVDAESAESLLDRGRPEIGDLLFTMEAPLGQVALIDRVDIALAQRIVKFRGRQGILHSNFLLYWFMGDHCQARLTTLATGSTALGIKASKLGMIECLVPPLDEQEAIVRYLEREFETLDALIEQAQAASHLLAERRTALISAAVTGKIDVRNWREHRKPEQELEPA